MAKFMLFTGGTALALLLGAIIDPASAGPGPCAVCGAPGPIVGAGLPLLVIIGGGAAWLFYRLRKSAE